MRQRDISAQAIIIMGVSGCGKSTLATLLAEKLDCPFFEGDSFHSAANVAKMRSGQPLDDADRWPWLDQLGAAIAAGVRANGMAIGACSALKHAYRDRLRSAIGVPVSFVLLQASREELIRRLEGRPGHYMPASLLDSQLATLEPPRPSEQAVAMESTPPPAALADKVIDWLFGLERTRAAQAG